MLNKSGLGGAAVVALAAVMAFGGRSEAASGLIGWWKLDDATGPVAADSAGAGDVSRAELGCTWLTHPMTVDEILVLDRALSADEVRDYVTAVRKLAEIGFPFEAEAAQ